MLFLSSKCVFKLFIDALNYCYTWGKGQKLLIMKYFIFVEGRRPEHQHKVSGPMNEAKGFVICICCINFQKFYSIVVVF